MRATKRIAAVMLASALLAGCSLTTPSTKFGYSIGPAEGQCSVECEKGGYKIDFGKLGDLIKGNNLLGAQCEEAMKVCRSVLGIPEQ